MKQKSRIYVLSLLSLCMLILLGGCSKKQTINGSWATNDGNIQLEIANKDALFITSYISLKGTVDTKNNTMDFITEDDDTLKIHYTKVNNILSLKDDDDDFTAQFHNISPQKKEKLTMDGTWVSLTEYDDEYLKLDLEKNQALLTDNDGLLLHGTLNKKKKNLDFEGTIVPYYMINNKLVLTMDDELIPFVKTSP